MRKWCFPGFVLVVYLATGFFFPLKTVSALEASLKILSRVLPAFGLVFLALFLMKKYMSRKFIQEKLEMRGGFSAWFFAVLSGLLSSGPVYVWYPLLSELREHGVSRGELATFLYNRAVKLPLLPVLVTYMGLKFTVLLTGLMVVFSLVQGAVFNLFYKASETSGKTVRN